MFYNHETSGHCILREWTSSVLSATGAKSGWCTMMMMMFHMKNCGLRDALAAQLKPGCLRTILFAFFVIVLLQTLSSLCSSRIPHHSHLLTGRLQSTRCRENMETETAVENTITMTCKNPRPQLVCILVFSITSISLDGPFRYGARFQMINNIPRVCELLTK